MTEDDVVRAVALHLREEGWTVDQELTTFDRGVDVVAKRDGVTLHVEAKGRTSSKVGTARYGRPFSRGQVRDHVAKAILTALEVASRGEAVPAIALPDDPTHREFVNRVAPAIRDGRGPDVLRQRGRRRVVAVPLARPSWTGAEAA